MRSTATRNSALVVVLFGAALASAHPRGFHKKVTVTVTGTRVSALVVMDVDSGDRCLLLREPADSNRDGVLAGDEVAKLKERLTKMVTSPLKFGLSGAPLPLQVKDTKLSLRDDKRANDSPLSVAVLMELEHPHAIKEGMQLEVTDVSPDASTIALQVLQDAGAPFEQQVESGVQVKVRLELPKR